MAVLGEYGSILEKVALVTPHFHKIKTIILNYFWIENGLIHLDSTDPTRLVYSLYFGTGGLTQPI